MPSESFTCPRCKAVTRDPALAKRGYCGKCHEFTGLCGAASLAAAIFATGVVSMPGWPHPCTTTGTESWQATGADGAVTGVLLCASHGDRLRRGATSWMEGRGLKLTFGATRREVAMRTSRRGAVRYGLRHAGIMSLPFPDPSIPVRSRTEVILGYLDFFRSRVLSKLDGLPDDELRRSRLPSGWTPIELLKHLIYAEFRWLEWRFEGRDAASPWADVRDGRWYLSPDETVVELTAALHVQAARSRAIVESHDLADPGKPSDRWDGPGPATLERILLHLIQEYARHLGHLDIAAELADGRVGE